ncbi:hypothetical protein [Larsenimonas rhizosphaerae]|uniref:Uncharacterized protein n=1 Tax=Larsenimonas rhizosphaerae TaxID=2944682 RepID=A0AA41ZGS8_9GAMM|nr:hypothetical protein [Larsenimonas rhizosphaerae]MCX2525002.1 hypothetical protein [Larsenimonas rhizosphaerae]
MVSEFYRRQYLEAMGLPMWEARYQLPHALPTPVCDWPEKPAVAPQPGTRGMAALRDAAAPVSESAAAITPPDSATAESVVSARALLDDIRTSTDSSPASAGKPAAAQEVESSAADPVVDTVPQEVRFTWAVAALEGRWLVVVPGRALGTEAQALLKALLVACRITPGHWPVFEQLGWPMIEGLPSPAPLDEAREGVKAFLSGRRGRGWVPERVMVFGQDEQVASVLKIEDGESHLLGLPVWQGPALEDMLGEWTQKRRLWPRLAEWHTWWHGEAFGAA